jgi:glycosyltransferase involved in cell wall biosynthesis
MRRVFQRAQRKDIELYLIYPGTGRPYNPHDLGFSAWLMYAKKMKARSGHFAHNCSDIIMMSSGIILCMCPSPGKAKQKARMLFQLDGQWRSTLKQNLNPYLPFSSNRQSITFCSRRPPVSLRGGWVIKSTGILQRPHRQLRNISQQPFENFIFIGRLVSNKGIEDLIAAYKDYRSSISEPWNLIIAGKGELKHICENCEGVELKDFVQPKDLPKLLSEASCFVLPSHFEPWGVVIHEAVIVGLPVICSCACGASTMFVRDGQNGYIVHPDRRSLTAAMKKMSAKTENQLEQMSAISRDLGLLWTSQKWADYVYENIVYR